MGTWSVLGVSGAGGGGVLARGALPVPTCLGSGIGDRGGGWGLASAGGGGGDLLPLCGLSLGGLGVPRGGSLGGGKTGGGEEFGTKSGSTGGFLLSICGNRQRCRAENGRSTHWSACDQGGGGDGEEDSETHIGVVLLLDGVCRCLIWASNSFSQSLLLYESSTNFKELGLIMRNSTLPAQCRVKVNTRG